MRSRRLMMIARAIGLATVGLALVAVGRGQEGRPATASETAEDLRVRRVIHDALPRPWGDWTLETETELAGTVGFHDGGMAARYPFTHEYKASYTLDLKSPTAARLKDAFDRQQIALVDLLAAGRIDVVVEINEFESTQNADTRLEPRKLTLFDVAVLGARKTALYVGPWTLVSNEFRDERAETVLKATRNMTVSMGQVQCLSLTIEAPAATRDEFLTRTNVAALRALIGTTSLQQRAIVGPSKGEEAPLAKPAAGTNEFRYDVEGPAFPKQSVSIPAFEPNQMTYLRNNHPDPQVVENAVTRVLVSAKEDTVNRTPTPFADITIPFVRRTGDFVVTKDPLDDAKATLALGIDCWNGCGWSLMPDGIKITVSHYDAVGGFVDGSFSGPAVAMYRAHEPVDHRSLPVTISNGYFKIRRKADRY